MKQFSPGRVLPPLLLFALGMLSARWLFPEPKTADTETAPSAQPATP